MSTKSRSSPPLTREFESPFLDHELLVGEGDGEWEPRAAALAGESPFVGALESGATALEGDEEGYEEEQETHKGLRQRLKFLSLLPHYVEWGGRETPLDPGLMNPGFYDGPSKYKTASTLQICLNAVMKKKQFSHIKVALVDLTKGPVQPEFAGFHHTDQVFAAAIPKLAAMLAAFQLRHDLRAALQKKGAATLDTLYEQVRDDWAATQINPHKLVLAGKRKVDLVEPKAPRLDIIFAPVPAGDPITIEFSSTGEDRTALDILADDFRDAKSGSKQKLDDLGFRERLRLMMTDKTRASDYVTSTIVRDVGYAYIASTLLQSGSYDPNRGGGLWLGADYAAGKWRGPLAGGDQRSANAGSVATFLTLLAQGSLVDRPSSVEMLALIETDLAATPLRAEFRQGLEQLKDGGSVESVHSRGGIANEGMDDCALIARQVDTTQGKETIRYIAVGLRAKRVAEVKALTLEAPTNASWPRTVVAPKAGTPTRRSLRLLRSLKGNGSPPLPPARRSSTPRTRRPHPEVRTSRRPRHRGEELEEASYSHEEEEEEESTDSLTTVEALDEHDLQAAALDEQESPFFFFFFFFGFASAPRRRGEFRGRGSLVGSRRTTATAAITPPTAELDVPKHGPARLQRSERQESVHRLFDLRSEPAAKHQEHQSASLLSR